ncbi:uncharacterized protein LOC119671556 [Teleopsis dalmanni]|uniref:uncharacterized protein LOC119670818 n=1 Tax=Teleopsis dalmanni TaxID=139649 RepID=UPI0018CE1AE1|nr:uncharacterized protein LOC119670818 [Teleopsis dalmanni]XP_037938178.1 uncharacterized protein LOC119671556 [Teleopsis dalmanni]
MQKSVLDYFGVSPSWEANNSKRTELFYQLVKIVELARLLEKRINRMVYLVECLSKRNDNHINKKLSYLLTILLQVRKFHLTKISEVFDANEDIKNNVMAFVLRTPPLSVKNYRLQH